MGTQVKFQNWKMSWEYLVRNGTYEHNLYQRSETIKRLTQKRTKRGPCHLLVSSELPTHSNNWLPNNNIWEHCNLESRLVMMFFCSYGWSALYKLWLLMEKASYPWSTLSEWSWRRMIKRHFYKYKCQLLNACPLIKCCVFMHVLGECVLTLRPEWVG